MCLLSALVPLTEVLGHAGLADKERFLMSYIRDAKRRQEDDLRYAKERAQKAYWAKKKLQFRMQDDLRYLRLVQKEVWRQTLSPYNSILQMRLASLRTKCIDERGAHVRAFPPSESFSRKVSFESR